MGHDQSRGQIKTALFIEANALISLILHVFVMKEFTPDTFKFSCSAFSFKPGLPCFNYQCIDAVSARRLLGEGRCPRAVTAPVAGGSGPMQVPLVPCPDWGWPAGPPGRAEAPGVHHHWRGSACRAGITGPITTLVSGK